MSCEHLLFNRCDVTDGFGKCQTGFFFPLVASPVRFPFFSRLGPVQPWRRSVPHRHELEDPRQV